MVTLLGSLPNYVEDLKLCQFTFHCPLSSLGARMAKTQALTQILTFLCFDACFHGITFPSMMQVSLLEQYKILKNFHSKNNNNKNTQGL